MSKSSVSKCQIIQEVITRKNLVVHIRDNIEDFEHYSELFRILPTLTDKDSLTVHLNTSGGRCDIGFQMIDAIGRCECPVEIIVEYPTYSMGAIMALCGDSLTLMPDTYIMFHDYSGGSVGKGGETALYTNNYREVFRKRFERICKPFLTQEECDQMFKGEDIYISDTDPSLKKRIKRHFR